MTGWEVVDLREDGDRWLVIYNVPAEYAPDGTYSVSFPKSMYNQYAAIFEYDLDSQQDVDDLFDHVTYIAYVNAVLHKEGRGHEVVASPYDVDPAEAKATIKAQVAEFKKNRPIMQGRQVRESMAAPSNDIHGALRNDMIQRLDKTNVGGLAETVAQTRRSAKELRRIQEAR